MAFDLDRLQSILLSSGLQKKDNALFQVINQLIQAMRDFQNETNASLSSSSTALDDGPFLTHISDLATFPSSRQLLAGAGINFDDSVFGFRTVKTTNISDYVAVSDGGEPALPLDDGFGSFIYIPYTP